MQYTYDKDDQFTIHCAVGGTGLVCFTIIYTEFSVPDSRPLEGNLEIILKLHLFIYFLFSNFENSPKWTLMQPKPAYRTLV